MQELGLRSDSNSNTNVNPSGLDSHRGREHVAREILSSEKSYVGSMELCCREIYQPVKERLQTITSAHSGRRISLRKEKFATQEEIQKIFSNIDKLLELHKQFCEKLEQRVATWTSESLIADIFLTETEFFSEYTRYAHQFSISSSTLAMCRERKTFHQFLEQLEWGIGVILPSFLIMPIQRLPRYELLLKELLKHTTETSQDYVNIPLALKALNKYTKKTNIAVNVSLSQVSEMLRREEAPTMVEATKSDEVLAEEKIDKEVKENKVVRPRSCSFDGTGKDGEGNGYTRESGFIRLPSTSFASVSEEEEVKVFHDMKKSPAHNKHSEAVHEKKKRRKSLIFTSKEKETEEAQHTTTVSPSVSDEDLGSEVATKKGRKKSFRLSWSLGDFKDSMAASFSEFQKEVDEAEGEAKNTQAEMRKSSLDKTMKMETEPRRHSHDEAMLSTTGEKQEKSRSNTKEEKDAEKERKRFFKKSRDLSSAPSSPASQSPPVPRKLSRLVGSVFNSKHPQQQQQQQKEEAATPVEWKYNKADTKIETIG